MHYIHHYVCSWNFYRKHTGKRRAGRTAGCAEKDTSKSISDVYQEIAETVIIMKVKNIEDLKEFTDCLQTIV